LKTDHGMAANMMSHKSCFAAIAIAFAGSDGVVLPLNDKEVCYSLAMIGSLCKLWGWS
jgi:hypothetical protein